MSEMSEANLAKVLAKKATFTEESKKRMLLAGGSLKTKYAIDAQQICREVRHGFVEDDYVDSHKDALKYRLESEVKI